MLSSKLFAVLGISLWGRNGTDADAFWQRQAKACSFGSL
jgi:hypothetical protein